MLILLLTPNFNQVNGAWKKGTIEDALNQAFSGAGVNSAAKSTIVIITIPRISPNPPQVIDPNQ